MDYCDQHGNMMAQYGGLKQGQEDVKESLKEIKTIVSAISDKQIDVRISASKEKVKSGLLYALLGMVAVALITAFVNLSFHVSESHYRNGNNHIPSSATSSNGVTK